MAQSCNQPCVVPIEDQIFPNVIGGPGKAVLDVHITMPGVAFRYLPREIRVEVLDSCKLVIDLVNVVQSLLVTISVVNRPEQPLIYEDFSQRRATES